MTFVVSDRDCAAFVGYQPDPSVAANSGVDVHGRPVAPADLDEGLAVKPDINIPITIDIRPWTDIDRHRPQRNFHKRPDEAKEYGAEPIVGMASFADGKVYFNGQALGTAQEHAVFEACADYLKRNRQ